MSGKVTTCSRRGRYPTYEMIYQLSTLRTFSSYITDQVSSNVSKEVLWAKFKFLNKDFIVSTGEGYENNILQEGNVAILHELKVKIILLTMRSSSMLSSSDKSATIEDMKRSVLFNGFVSLLTILVMSNFLPYIT